MTTVEATVAAGVLCRQCGYDLRGLTSEGRCPECGADVVASVAAADLQATGLPVPLSLANRRWLRSVSRGAATIVVGSALFVLVNLFAMYLIRSDRLFAVWWPSMNWMPIISGVCLVIGAWRMSMPEPHVPASRSTRWARAGMRWGLAVAIAVVFAPFCLLSRAIGLFGIYSWALALAGVVPTVAALSVAKALIRRGGQPGVAHWVGILRWAVVATAVGEGFLHSLPLKMGLSGGDQFLPLAGDVSGASNLIGTELYDPRVDGPVLMVVAATVLSAAVVSVWVVLWGMLRRVGATPARPVHH